MEHGETRKSTRCSRSRATARQEQCCPLHFSLWWWDGKGAEEESSSSANLCLVGLCPQSPAYPPQDVWWYPPSLFCVRVPLLRAQGRGPRCCSPGLGTNSLSEHACGEKLTSPGIKMHPKGGSTLQAPLPAEPPRCLAGHVVNPQSP